MAQLPDADAFLIVVPYYNKPTQTGLYEYYKAVAGSTDKPIVIYNVPGRTGTNIQAETTLRLAEEIPNVIAVKEASSNYKQISEIIRNKPEGFTVLSGNDDEKQVPAARTVPEMSYRAALDMAEHGAKVLYAPTVAPAMEAGIDIEIRNTFAPSGRYTRISSSADATPWIGVTSSAGEICLVGTPDSDFETVESTIRETLRSAGIAPLAVSVEGCDVLVRVRESVELPALQALHRAFFETRPVREVSLFIAGFGAVGKALADMVGRTADTVAERTGKTLRVAGVADSRRYCIDPGGLAAIDLSRDGTAGDFVDAVIDLAPKGCPGGSVPSLRG